MIRILLVLLLLGSWSESEGATPWGTFGSPLGSVVINAAAKDNLGNLYITGATFGYPGFPNAFVATPGAFQQSFHPNPGPECNYYGFIGRPCVDAFVAKVDASGSLVYATFLGGIGNEEAIGIVVDQAGHAWVTGYTYSSDFPVTENAAQKRYAGSPNPTGSVTSSSVSPGGDVFLSELSADGTTLIYSTFFGGSGPDIPLAIATDSSGNIYVCGQNGSIDLPVTTDQPEGSGYIIKFDPSKQSISYASYFPGAIYGLATSSTGDVYVTGAASFDFPTTSGGPQAPMKGSSDAFLAELSPDGKIQFSTLLGGRGPDYGSSIAVDAVTGNVWIVGVTASPDFPGDFISGDARPSTLAYGAFVACFSPNASLRFAKVLGDTSPSFKSWLAQNNPKGSFSIQMTASGAPWIFFQSSQPDFPITPDAVEGQRCRSWEYYITKWSIAGELLYSSVVGEGMPVATNGLGSFYLVPERADANQALLIRFDTQADERPPVVSCLESSGKPSPLQQQIQLASPGEVVDILGDRIGPAGAIYAKADAGGALPTSLGGITALFNGKPMGLIYASEWQLTAIVPWSATPGTDAVLTVTSDRGTSSITVPVAAANPGFFAGIRNQDNSLNSPQNPAALGSVISLFGTGLGVLSPLPPDGGILNDTSYAFPSAPKATFSFKPSPPVSQTLVPGEITYAGIAPGLAGVFQVNVRIPGSVPDATNLGNVEIRIQVSDAIASQTLTIKP